MKYTAEEVRVHAQKELHNGLYAVTWDMLTAYAERIKVDEDALPASLEQFREAIVFACVNGNADKWRRVLASFDSFAYRYKRSCTPPAQAVQVDLCNSLLRGKAQNEEPRVRHSCTMGVGCEETGVCYAEANGQPEQCDRPIDLAAVREVIASHIEEAKKLRHDPESQDYLYEQADKLTAAIKGVD